MMGMEPTVRVPLKRRTAGTIRLFVKSTQGYESATFLLLEGRVSER